MTKEKTKVYIYTRVSTAMQIDGYSLEAQKTRMKGFCAYNEYEIAGEYEDSGDGMFIFQTIKQKCLEFEAIKKTYRI